VCVTRCVAVLRAAHTTNCPTHLDSPSSQLAPMALHTRTVNTSAARMSCTLGNFSHTLLQARYHAVSRALVRVFLCTYRREGRTIPPSRHSRALTPPCCARLAETVDEVLDRLLVFHGGRRGARLVCRTVRLSAPLSTQPTAQSLALSTPFVAIVLSCWSLLRTRPTVADSATLAHSFVPLARHSLKPTRLCAAATRASSTPLTTLLCAPA
jgi:hypothetical protein